jgi:tetratricopeptide (TPR) repeat protein
VAQIAAIGYRAFLSYSHRDKAWGKWLHGALEGYRIDKDLVGRVTPAGVVPRTLRPIFRDREDFAAGHSLTAQTLAALAASEFLIVLCSPHSAQSKYVNEEIRRFKAMGRADRVIPVIVGGEPGDPERECIPLALRFKIGADGALTEEPEEPIAADARPEGDGREVARLKVIAGLLGMRLDDIVNRAERARRRHNRGLAALTGTFLLLAVVATGSAIYAYKKFLESDERVDQAIEIAYGFVTKAVAKSNQIGISVDATMEVLQAFEAALETFIKQGEDTPLLRHRRALMLIEFADNYLTLGQTAQSLDRATLAGSILERLVETRPSHFPWKHDLLVAYQKIGNALAEQGLLARALDRYQASLDIAKALTAADPKDPEWQRDLSVAYNKIGDVLRPLGNLTAALDSYRQSLEIRKRLSATDPSNLRWQRDLASVHDRLGDVLSAQGNLIEALNSYNECRDITERLVSSGNNSDWLRGLAVVTDKIGDVERAQGNLAAALVSYERSRAIRERLTGWDAKNNRWQRDLAQSHMKIGNVLTELHKLPEAEKSYRLGFAITESLARSDPKNTIWQRDLASAYDNIGDVFRAMTRRDGLGLAAADDIDDIFRTQGILAKALKSYRAGLEIRLRLLEADSKNAFLQYDVGVSHAHVGEVLLAQRDFAGAAKEYEEAKDIFISLVAADPRNAFWRHDLALVH